MKEWTVWIIPIVIAITIISYFCFGVDHEAEMQRVEALQRRETELIDKCIKRGGIPIIRHNNIGFPKEFLKSCD